MKNTNEGSNRLRRFLFDLDRVVTENEYYDDEENKEVCTITEDQCYEVMMENKEYHLLTAEVVRGFVRMFLNDYEGRAVVLQAYKVL